MNKTVTLTHDRNGNPIVNSMGESFVPPVTALCHSSSRNGHVSPDAPVTHPLRLNLGGTGVPLEGWTNLDRKEGKEAYPLDVPDNSVEEILASHVLEHFSHREAGPVAKHWADKLAPGGRIRIAVPDFELIAKAYLADEPIDVQGYVMGGHLDGDDRHGTVFDRESLTELLINCGLERITPWKSDMPGASSLPVSLNLQAFKPSGPTPKHLPDVRICASTPRFGPLLHQDCVKKACLRLGIDGNVGQSCFWHQKLSVMMEEAIAEPTCDYVVTVDFDTVFTHDDLLELYRLLKACPDVDAVFPIQSKRGCEEALFSLPHTNPARAGTITSLDLARNLLPARTGHFGLTMFRADSLRRFARPWMVPRPNEEGKWSEGSTDADIDFWRNWESQGFSCALAPRVVVGHLEEVIKWPGKDLRPVYQQVADYEARGIPAEVAR